MNRIGRALSPSIVDTLAGIGLATERRLGYLGGLGQILGQSLVHAITSPLKRRLTLKRAIHQCMLVGVQAIPIISLITFFIGVIMALQGAYELRKLGALQLVASVVAISITRELGPLITAIVVIGRSGSAFAAEIGTMAVTEELDALDTMALHPMDFLVTPKILAMLIMMPCLSIWADLMGVLGGSLFGVTSAGFTAGSYFSATLDALLIEDIVTGLIKSLIFALVITAVGCREGFATGSGSEEVGRSTTNAVVTSIFLVIVVDLVFTFIFYLVKGA